MYAKIPIEKVEDLKNIHQRYYDKYGISRQVMYTIMHKKAVTSDKTIAQFSDALKIKTKDIKKLIS